MVLSWLIFWQVHFLTCSNTYFKRRNKLLKQEKLTRKNRSPLIQKSMAVSLFQCDGGLFLTLCQRSLIKLSNSWDQILSSHTHSFNAIKPTPKAGAELTLSYPKRNETTADRWKGLLKSWNSKASQDLLQTSEDTAEDFMSIDKKQ